MSAFFAIFLAILTDPILWVGCLLAGMAIRRYWISLAAGLAWGTAVGVMMAATQEIFWLDGFIIRLLVAALMTSAIFMIGRWKRCRRPVDAPSTIPLDRQ